MARLPSIDQVIALILLIGIFLIFLGREIIRGFGRQAGQSAWKKLTRSQSRVQIDLAEDSVEELLIRAVDEDELLELLEEKIEGNKQEHEEKTAFLSYTIEDEEYAKEMREELEKRSYEAITPTQDLTVGDNLRDRISELMQRSDLVVVLLSNAAMNSGWVQHELSSALMIEKDASDFLVIPVILEDFAQLPTELEQRVYLRAGDSISDTVDEIDRVLQAHFK